MAGAVYIVGEEKKRRERREVGLAINQIF